jgi:hypothetical protein
MNIEEVTDDLIIRETVNRLTERVKEMTGLKLTYGEFVLSIYKGRCSKIDFSLKERCFNPRPINNNGDKNEHCFN